MRFARWMVSMEREADKPDGLHITEEAAFHRLSWTAQRIAWATLAALVLAALLGVFGAGGPLSRAQARTPDGALQIHYERFVRRGAPARIEVHVAAALVDAGEIRLHISREYLASLRIEWITPLPLRVEAAGVDIVYVFAAGARSASVLTFHLQTQGSGRRHARFAVGPNHSLGFIQFAYP